MSLSVQLDSSRNHIFIPGDRVSGRVILRCDKEQNVDSVTIRFRGKVKTVVGESQQHTHTGRHVLFEQQKTLFRGPYTLPGPDTHGWPFDFIFPEHFTRTVKGGYENSQQFGTLETPQALPPSLYSHESGQRSTGVTYMVVAKIPKSFVDVKAKHALQFSPVRQEARPNPCHETREHKSLIHHFRIGDNGIPRSLTSKEILKDAFKTSKDTRKIQFSVAVEVPTVMVLGERVPFQVTVKSTIQDEVTPPFSVGGFRACFHGISKIRAPGIFGDHVCILESDYHVEATSRSRAAVELNCPKALGGIELDPRKFAPSFVSFSIVRSYYLSLRVLVRCCSKDFEVKLKFPTLILVSSKLRQLSDGMSPDIDTGLNRLSLTGEEAEVAPAYEPAVAPAPAIEQPPAYEPESSAAPVEMPLRSNIP